MKSRRAFALAAVLLVAAACRTGRPSGAPVTPLTWATTEEASQALRAQRESFRGMKSLMRVRATRNGQTQSFRAQLIVHDARRMELIAYTPVGTTALTMKADGDRITTDPAVPPESFAFLRESGMLPAEVGMLLLGIPPRGGNFEIAPGGLDRWVSDGIAFDFDPPSFPAKRVVVTRGGDRVEIEHLEVVSE